MPKTKTYSPDTLPAVGGRTAVLRQLSDGAIPIEYRVTDTSGGLHEATPYTMAEVVAMVLANDPLVASIVAMYPSLAGQWPQAFEAVIRIVAEVGDSKAGFVDVP